ncbi:MAG: cysteine desulfurase [Salinivirgaceae bacterium]|nr:cysteine desulfurase [Salinivirgaceae bacterium]
MDVQSLRDNFEILSQTIYNKPLIYFDNAATSQKPNLVLDTIREFETKWNANVHRGVHFLSNYCTDAVEKSRKTIAHFIGANSEREVVFTSGTTDSVNIIADTFGRSFLKPGDEILVSQMEHHSNFVPWQQIAHRHGAKFVVFDILDNGEVDLDDYKRKLNSKTRMVAFAHVSNALGTVNPIEQMIALARKFDTAIFVDGAQAIQHIKVNVQELDVDFYAFSGHKMYGPTGVGILYGKEAWLEKLPPYRFGGEMIEKVANDITTFNELPFKFEAGTPNYTAQIGLGKAVEYIETVGISNMCSHETELLEYATRRLKDMDGITIYGTSSHKTSVLSFLVDGIHPYDIGIMLDKMGIAVRTGNHCAQPLFTRLGIDGTVRASFAFYNTTEEIDFFIESLQKIISMFR